MPIMPAHFLGGLTSASRTGILDQRLDGLASNHLCASLGQRLEPVVEGTVAHQVQAASEAAAIFGPIQVLQGLEYPLRLGLGDLARERVAQAHDVFGPLQIGEVLGVVCMERNRAVAACWDCSTSCQSPSRAAASRC
jgi:hypothetical protein